MMCIGDISQQTMHMHLKACWVLIVLFIRISNNNLIFIHNKCYKVTRRTSLFRAIALISFLYLIQFPTI